MPFHTNLGDGQIHRIYDQSYASDAARDADTAWNGAAANVGKTVLITGTNAVHMLLSTGPTWFTFGGAVANPNTIYNADDDIAGDRTITAPSGRQLELRALDLLASTYLKAADITLHEDTVDIEARVGDGAGGIASISRILINNATMQILDQTNSKGLVYGADYSVNYSDRSLVDKGFTDNYGLSQTKDADAGTQMTDLAALGFKVASASDAKVMLKHTDGAADLKQVNMEYHGGLFRIKQVDDDLSTKTDLAVINAATKSFFSLGSVNQQHVTGGSRVVRNTADDEIEIWGEADFGTAVAGEITLVGGRTYDIMDSFTLTSSLVIPTGASVQFRTPNRSNAITYTHATKAMFQGTNIGTLALLDIVLDGNSTGTLLNIDGGVLSFKFPDFNSWSSLGTVDNLVDFFAPGMFIDTSTGLDMTNCASCTIVDTLALISTSGAAVFVINGASSGDLQFYNNILEASNANNSLVNIDGATFPATKTVNLGGNNIVVGQMFHSSSIDKTDDRVISRGNKGTGAADSTASAVGTAFDQAATATLLDQNIPNYINATFTEQSVERFDVLSSGVFHHIGSQSITTQVMASITGKNTTGTAISMNFYLGLAIFGNGITAFADAGGGQITVTTTVAHGFSNGDRVNLQGTTNHDGTWTIANVTSTTFEITDTFVATGTGFAPRKILEQTKASNSFSNADKNTMLIAQVDMDEDHFLQLFVENTDSVAEWETTDINVTIAKI